MIAFINNYAGVLVGTVILLISVLYLPSKIRAYVLTGGLAVLVYRTWQIYTSNAKLKSLDKQREDLRKDQEILKQRALELEQKQLDIRNERDAILEKVAELKKEKQQLNETSDDLNQHKKNLDKTINQLLSDHDASQAKWDSIALAMHKLNTVKHIVEQDPRPNSSTQTSLTIGG